MLHFRRLKVVQKPEAPELLVSGKKYELAEAAL